MWEGARQVSEPSAGLLEKLKEVSLPKNIKTQIIKKYFLH
jgi:hypothetical protein